MSIVQYMHGIGLLWIIIFNVSTVFVMEFVRNMSLEAIVA